MRAEASRTETALQHAVETLAFELEEEQILGGDDVTLHADDLGDVGNAAHPVAHT